MTAIITTSQESSDDGVSSVPDPPPVLPPTPWSSTLTTTRFQRSDDDDNQGQDDFDTSLGFNFIQNLVKYQQNQSEILIFCLNLLTKFFLSGIKNATEGLKHQFKCLGSSVSPNGMNPILVAWYCETLVTLNFPKLIKPQNLNGLKSSSLTPSAPI